MIMRRICGIETEYGITIDGVDEVDVVAESIQVVRAYTRLVRASKNAALKWNYDLEDPHLDARGFRVKELLQDFDEANYFEQDRHRKISFRELKSDLVLSNGARFYNDHAHPEYSTPECHKLRDLVAHDKAGERILEQCMRWRNASLKRGRLKLYKNNTDFFGHSYGCHDNYLMERVVPFDYIVAAITPFLVTRQIFSGAGKVGAEGDDPRHADFQISQRADFFSVLVSIDTMNRRPVVNTRDEPHADAARYRRLHVILGDANMSEVATALKMGTTNLVIDLMELRVCPSDIELADPVYAVRSISRDPQMRAVIPLRNGKTISALDIQRRYLAVAQKHLGGRDEQTDWLLTRWARVLDELAVDPMKCVGYVDWVAKKFLLDTFREAERVNWDDPWLKSLDLEYHSLDRQDGLYFGLLETKSIERFVTDTEIHRAMKHPPADTRAYFRGRCVDRFAPQMTSVQWDELVFQGERGESLLITLNNLFHDKDIARYNEAVDKAKDAATLFRMLKQ
jgi:proteasome accessory factor A